MDTISNKTSSQKNKKKTKVEKPIFENTSKKSPTQSLTSINLQSQSLDTDVKRRGRKPKGGKLIEKNQQELVIVNPIVNIIMHLKCSLKDIHCEKTELVVKDPLSYDPAVPPEIKTYNEAMPTKQFAIYNEKEKDEIHIAYREPICKKCNLAITMATDQTNDAEVDTEYADIHMKDIHVKLKQLRSQYCKNYPVDKKSACFWCTYEFDNPACFIPKYDMNNTIFGYGSFCRPECAVAYLWRDNLDDSTKFERYHLLNQIYSKVYGFKKNIKPAPDPYYLLDKFYGNMTIQEYRKLLKTEYLLQVLEKPMTRIFPEVHEDNDDFLLNVYGGVKQQIQNTGGVYKVKRQSEKQKGPTKNSIARTNFGLSD
jgi:hypothetical protein